MSTYYNQKNRREYQRLRTAEQAIEKYHQSRGKNYHGESIAILRHEEHRARMSRLDTTYNRLLARILKRKPDQKRPAHRHKKRRNRHP